MMRVPRLLAVLFVSISKGSLRSSFFVLTALLLPVIYATLAHEMFAAGATEREAFRAALGAGLMGIWSVTLFDAGNSINEARWRGTIELLVAAPTRLALTVFGMTLASSALSLLALVGTLAWSRLVYGVEIQLAHPLAGAAALVATVFSLGALGLLLSTIVVHLRHGSTLMNMGEFPVWLLSGALVPLALLPGWTGILSAVLAPTQAVRALQAATMGGNAWPAIGWSLVLGLGYITLAIPLMTLTERRARETATLALV